MADQNNYPIIRKNAPALGLPDLYYRLVRLKWLYLIGSTFVFYLAVNLCFAILYYWMRAGLRPSGMSFADSFLFSVHTFSTVGYDTFVPASVSVQWVTILEIFAGLVFLALLTGLFFSKFSQPSARFLFSQKILITQNHRKPAILFRIANARNNRVMDAEVTLTALFDEMSAEGIQYRRLEDLPLDRSKTPVFALSLTCAHFLAPGSSAEKLLARMAAGENIEFLISIRGLDDTFGQTIHATKVYRANQLARGGQFADILTIQSDGTRMIDFAKFNEIKQS